jgi:hypothetical protein
MVLYFDNIHLTININTPYIEYQLFNGITGNQINSFIVIPIRNEEIVDRIMDNIQAKVRNLNFELGVGPPQGAIYWSSHLP